MCVTRVCVSYQSCGSVVAQRQSVNVVVLCGFSPCIIGQDFCKAKVEV